jgi:crotonobetainyl-CoA:carnitine CoA-transferase CaiB-like acyl-CoA transferase
MVKKLPDSALRPLAGLKVVDFSTLLPGPFASLILAEAGAEVMKIERPVRGDDMRSYEPKLGADSANFVLLNRGKSSLALDLKNPEDNAEARKLAIGADIIIEQFRPGVMTRLGLGYDDVARENPGVIYCSITGYGQNGPKAKVAAHDLNYVAEAGLLSLVADLDGTPTLPPLPLADIGGGSYPAIMNIFLALYERERTGQGRYLDISMSDNVLPFLYWAIGNGALGHAPRPNAELITGGSPRYKIYRARDGRFLAAAPLEPQFWAAFCVCLEVPQTATAAEIATRVSERDADDWMRTFEGHDVCCSIVASMDEAMNDSHFAARRMFSRTVSNGSQSMPALPLPLVQDYRDPELFRSSPVMPKVKAPSSPKQIKIRTGGNQ